MFYNEPKTLIVVYKDELLVNQIRKLVETNDDASEEEVIGTRDGSVRIVSWSEKMWLQQKKAGNIDSKVLFVGDIKGTEKLLPIMDVIFDDCGVKYGWAGNQALIAVDSKAVKKKEDYEVFLQKLRDLPIPEAFKNSKKLPEKSTGKGSTLGGVLPFLGFFGGIQIATAMYIKDVFADKLLIEKQMLFYGVISLYNNDLEKFMHA